MRLPVDMFAKLPFSLFITSLALATRALPVESQAVELKVLTPDNFTSVVAKGVWFVEHYSPYCPHCKHFEPTWVKLSEHYGGMEDPGIELAQVNCATNGDLCNKNGVTGYPQMNIYKDGEFIERFKGAREWDALTKFIDQHAEQKSSSRSVQEKLGVSHETHEAHLETAANRRGAVISLNPSNFESVIAEGPTFVKFFAPWCGHCKKLAPIWLQLAGHMKGKLAIAEVDCDAHSALCKTQGIAGYPTLTFYNGRTTELKSDYNGGRKFEQLKSFAEKAVGPAVSQVDSEQDLVDYVKQHDVVYLLLHSNNDDQVLGEVNQASTVLLGQPPILTSPSSTLRARFAIPSATSSNAVLIAIKDGSATSYTSIFTFPSSFMESNAKQLSEWLLRNRLPSALELTQETFQPVMNAPHQPLVVLAAVSSKNMGAVSEVMRDSASAWRGRNNGVEVEREVVFAWMDAEKWSSWMKSMYGIKSSTLPAIVLVEHQNLIYYDTDVRGNKIGVEPENILPAVDDVLNGRMTPKYSENIVERMARYLNNSITSLETSVLGHPYLAMMLGLILVGVFAFAIKRFINSDLPSSQYANGHEYARLQKSPGRLD